MESAREEKRSAAIAGEFTVNPSSEFSDYTANCRPGKEISVFSTSCEKIKARWRLQRQRRMRVVIQYLRFSDCIQESKDKRDAFFVSSHRWGGDARLDRPARGATD